MSRDTEKERPGRGAPQVVLATKLADPGNATTIPPYRVVWRREGWVQTMDAARALKRSHPAWPALLTLRTDEWIEGAAIDGAWGAIFTHMDPTDSTRPGGAS